MHLGKRLGAGARAEVYEYGPSVLKLYNAGIGKLAAFREAAILAYVEMLGLPAPAVSSVLEVDGRWGLVMTRVEGPTFGEAAGREQDRMPDYLAAMVGLHRRVHEHRAGAQLVGLRRRLAASIDRAEMLGDVRKARLLEGLAARPDGDRLCHGDFHPLNIIGPIGAPVMIDWPDASRGDPAADVCRTRILLHPHAPEIAAAYVDAYAAASSVSREAVMAWEPFVAAGRLSEGVSGREADELMAMADAI